LHNLETGFSVVVQGKATTQVYNIIFLYNVLLDCTKNAYSQRGFKTLPTQLLAWANADKEATTMYFAMSNDWLR